MGVWIQNGEAVLGYRTLNPGELGDDLETLVTALPVVADASPTNTQPLRVLARGHATKRTWLRVFHTYTTANDYTLTVNHLDCSTHTLINRATLFSKENRMLHASRISTH